MDLTPKWKGEPYLVDVLALELIDEGLETVLIGLNANGLEDGLDILGGGGGVATEAEEKVSCEMLHFEWLFFWSANNQFVSCVRRRREDMVRKDGGRREAYLGEHEKSINLTANLGRRLKPSSSGVWWFLKKVEMRIVGQGNNGKGQ